ncbi:hypothetical protein IMZ31_19355 (plasmid) [Pontibacillus sp. ALD_SL1]|uniref:hypothetical protein n=1 Tax=Pontibacillus sp. ALD_SL1 TaxID=2777185 RepID=UPI001A96438F|nr:hypothetical protein [Pontibacillus sp. ALD_SL1]QST02708.1 hypothetical protein IMZ31_19355 [Pontibacillus sp. ALD_SL1]
MNEVTYNGISYTAHIVRHQERLVCMLKPVKEGKTLMTSLQRAVKEGFLPPEAAEYAFADRFQ